MKLNNYNNLLELFFSKYQSENKSGIFLQSLKDKNLNFTWKQTGSYIARAEYSVDAPIKFIREELMETEAALTNDDAEEIVDGLIDICVVAIGTLDAFGVDPYKAWDEVLKANLNKTVGVKPERPNPLGLPDLIKPEGWEGPSHEGNHGKFNNIR